MGLRSRLKKLTRRIKRTAKSVYRLGVEHPLKFSTRLARGDIKGAVSVVRASGRQQIFGIRAREVGAVVAAAFGGYAAYGAYAASAAGTAGAAGAGAGASIAGAGAGTVAVGSTAAAVGGSGVAAAGAGTLATGAAVTGTAATGFTATLGSIAGAVGTVAKTAATVFGLSSLLGLRNPGMGPETLPQENVWNGMTPAMYGYGGGSELSGSPLGFGAASPSGSALYDSDGGLPISPIWILAILAIVGAAFIFLRK